MFSAQKYAKRLSKASGSFVLFFTPAVFAPNWLFYFLDIFEE
jgi:hypothetical protein